MDTLIEGGVERPLTGIGFGGVIDGMGVRVAAGTYHRRGVLVGLASLTFAGPPRIPQPPRRSTIKTNNVIPMIFILMSP